MQTSHILYWRRTDRVSICSREEIFSHQLSLIILYAADQHRSSQLHAVCRHKVITGGVLHTVFFSFGNKTFFSFAVSLCLSLYLH